jgi:hypothetical protein
MGGVRAQHPLFSTADSGVNVFFGATIRTLASYSPKRTLPGYGANFVLMPKDGSGVENTFDITARASNLYFSVDGPKVGDFRLGGKIFAYLTKDISSPTYGFLPALMYMEAKNDKWRFSAGQQVDVFAQRIPNMVDGYFALAASGCAGNSSRGQLRAEHYLPVGEKGKVTLTLAASQPITNYFSSDLRNNTANRGTPNLEWAAKFQTGSDPDAWVPWDMVELGVSGVMGSYRIYKNDTLGGVIVNKGINKPRVRGYAGEFAFRTGKRFGVQGEVYAGQALGNYLGGILQTTKGPKDKEVRSAGWWVEGAMYWKRNVQSRFGYGQDACRQEDLIGGGIYRNSTVYGNLIWDINRSLSIGFEATHKSTKYVGLSENQGMTWMGMVQYSF